MPPHALGIVLGPAGLRDIEIMRDGMPGGNATVGGHENAFGAVGADVNSEKIAHILFSYNRLFARSQDGALSEADRTCYTGGTNREQ